MSVRDRWKGMELDRVRARVDVAARLGVRVFVGDRLGLLLFLGTLVFTGLYLRIGVLITDNHTLANAIAALSGGQLAVEEAVYGSLEAPGTHIHDGTAYGRNYGQLAFTLPFLWTLQGLSHLADFGLVFAALWSLLVLGLAVQTGRAVGRPSLCTSVGAVVALVLFGVSAALAEPIPERMVPVAALQLGAMTATALAGVTIYRLLARMHGRRVGAVTGALVVGATPVGFWASLPKRHVFVVALVFGIAYALYRSREEADPEALLSATGFRALAYALVGLVTWIHAGEGFVVFLALLLVDVPTARSNDRRTLAIVGGSFALSMVPFFLTNVLISGDPVTPPRMLSQYGERGVDPGFGESLGGGSSGSGSSGSGSSGGSSAGGTGVVGRVRSLVAGPVGEVTWLVTVLFGPIKAGMATTIDEPDRLYRIFVRGGYLSGVGVEDNNQAIYLTVLESTPLAAGAVLLAGTAFEGARGAMDRLRNARSRLSVVSAALRRARSSSAFATDAFVSLMGLLFFFVYVVRLPLHAQVTVRYLLVAFPVVLYAIARQPIARRVLRNRGRLALWSYAASVLVGAQLFLVVVVVRNLGRGEAFQLHAVVGLAAAAVLGVCALASVLDDRFDPLTAVVGGLAAALGTDFLLLSGLVYFQYGPYALPVADYLADLIAAA